jgi:hypothetical protein
LNVLRRYVLPTSWLKRKQELRKRFVLSTFEEEKVTGTTTTREGVCCYCQEIHPINPASADLFEDDNPADSWVMADHIPTFGGTWCEGFNTTPQAIVKE